MSHFVDNLLIFGGLLRGLGLEVHLGRLLDVTQALQHVDVGSRDEVYHTCRALLVHRHEDLEIFDAAFDAFWRAHRPQQDRDADLTRSAPHERKSRSAPHEIDSRSAPHETDSRSAPHETDSRSAPHETDSRSAPHETDSRSVPHETDSRAAIADLEADSPSGALQTWSDVDVIADKDFAEFTGEEVALARAALDRLVWSPGERRTRHWVAGRGSRIDLRRALARSIRTGGDVVALPRRRRRTRPRPIVLLCDVSGSMEHYSRILLQFVHAMGRRHRRFEAFLFSTRLTRITKELRTRDLDEAVAAVSRSVPDWSGGTRIGDALRLFHQRWARVVLHRGPVVLLISDGWDRGDPVVLRDQVARLQRSCHRLIWLNPLIGTTDYAPLTRGLVAALPFVDDFLPVRTLNNLAGLALHLNALRAG